MRSYSKRRVFTTFGPFFVLALFSKENCQKWEGRALGHSDVDRFTRTKVQNLIPLFSREKWPEFRRKRDLYEPLLTAMAQVFPSFAKKRQNLVTVRMGGGGPKWGVEISIEGVADSQLVSLDPSYHTVIWRCPPDKIWDWGRLLQDWECPNPQKFRGECWKECREKGGLLGGLLGTVLGGQSCWEKQRNGTVPSSPPSYWHSSQHSHRHFWGFGLSQSCSRRPRSQDKIRSCAARPAGLLHGL